MSADARALSDAAGAGRSEAPRFDRTRFDAALATRRVGRTLLVRERAGSTNDLAWEALAEGLPDGVTVIAEAQEEGRGRSGRRWFMAPGRGLALSVALHLGCDRRQASALPLVAGLALARALDGLGVATDLKWPNDLLLAGRKLSGVLVELRRLPGGGGQLGGEAVVIGVGVNVGERTDDFPDELRATATSLALAGHDLTREDIAAALLNQLEPLWDELQEGSRAALLDAWKQRASFWGRPVTAATPTGAVTGVAVDLDPDGALIVRRDDGALVTVVAGDLTVSAGGV
jgi:BirA family biotin operon repressor/biotin-[acetyl-CoA-carboxylase] ligase